MTIDVDVKNLTKEFDQFTAVKNVNFQVEEGQFFSILGPSGCGKTTLLRMLAGFEHPSSGDILIKGKSQLELAPNKRNVNMVFQHLALFPNMNVAENIAFGLKRQGVDKALIAKKTDEVLARVSLPNYGQKKISQLSGGQKQRIAIARCLVLDPDLLLLDEPLGALDLKLREHMKVELKQLQAEFGTSFIYITHDQSEALVMSDQVAVMDQGQFVQIDSPKNLYYNPKTPFVASFVGNNNRFDAKIIAHSEDQISVKTENGLLLNCYPAPDYKLGDDVSLFVRPESIQIVDGQGEDHIEVKVENVLFDGANSQILVRSKHGNEQFNVRLPQTEKYQGLSTNDEIAIQIEATQIQHFLRG